jgi:two-component system NtrC family sensor kinase
MAPSKGRHGLLRVNLTMKLVMAVVASFAVLVALFSYLSLREHRLHSEQLVLTSADRVTDLIQRSTHYQMLHNDREALYYMINAQGSEPGLRRIRIFNEEGRVSFSTVAGEVNRVVDKKAEACYGCHAEAAPLTQLARPDRSRVFLEPNGERTLAMIRPIENEPACSNAACHAHPPNRRILGVIDAHLSLASVDAQLAEYRDHLAWFAVLAVALGSLVSVGFILLVVHRPVSELMTGIRKVAAGDLGRRLLVHSNDELGALAASFNRMTEDLSRANAEITAWTRTLEDRVEKKTQELEKAYAGLIASGKLASLGKLAATVAHEVNNPLFGILTYSRLALRELERADGEPAQTAKVADQLHIIERESKRCGEIVKNLLAFARQQPPRRQPQDVATLVHRTMALVRHQMDIQGVEVTESLSGELPRCLVDADQVQQVLLVLLMNAAEAMPKGGNLYVAGEWDRESARVLVRIKDNGMGIAADVLPHIFEPFFTTKEDQHRTGLGLTVARNIAEQHGGTLTAVSTLETGTQFTLSLPIDALAATGATPTENVNVRT